MQTRTMASLIADAAPEKLLQLKRDYPSHEKLFDTVYVMGKDDEADKECSDTNMLALRTLALTALNVSTPALERLTSGMLMRSRWARRTRLAGTTITVISTASAIAIVTTAHPSVGGYVSLVTLAGSLLVLAGEHLEKSLLGSQKSMMEMLGEVAILELGLKDIEVSFLAENLNDRDVVISLARKANEMAVKVKRLCRESGLSIRPA